MTKAKIFILSVAKKLFFELRDILAFAKPQMIKAKSPPHLQRGNIVNPPHLQRGIFCFARLATRWVGVGHCEAKPKQSTIHLVILSIC
ncbi:hypothetical protein DMC01_10545 [Campylobacter troglodytis]|nr:hypothetical protein DMC01_10545 [Campylobacter troglodytis]